MKHGYCIAAVLAVAILFSAPAVAQSRSLSRTERYTASAEGVTSVTFSGIEHSDLTYKGIPGAKEFSINFERTAKSGDPGDLEELLSELALETATADGKVSIRLIHPPRRSPGVVNRLLKRRQWETTIEITGPGNVDMTIDAGFSKIRTSGTSGILNIDADFSDTIVSGHAGRIEGACEFGSFTVNSLEGSFSFKGSFGSADIDVADLAGNSDARMSFGSLNLRLPRNRGAELRSNKSFGNINFMLDNTVDVEYDGSRRIVGGGGPIVNLESDFGEITVRSATTSADSRQEEARVDSGQHVVMPLASDAWWRYGSGGSVMNVSIRRSYLKDGLPAATLTFSVDGETVSTYDVVERNDGILLTRINGHFLGKELDGVSFDPPRLWLPYQEGSGPVDDYILGTVRTAIVDGIETPDGTKNNVYRYVITYGDGEEHVLMLAPGIGFVAIGAWKLTDYDLGRRDVRAEPPAPKPRFEQGVIKSVRIDGCNMLSESEVRGMLGINEGETRTRKEIADAVSALEKKHRFIASTRFDIDLEGNLRVIVREKRMHTRDIDMDGSFTRIGGVGLGPELTITSLVGPLSEIKGSAQYHFADHEWTYRGSAEKSFFNHNRLAFGGTYRLDYESSMDWAIPKWDQYLNALFAGLETNHYHKVEGASGYASLSFGPHITIRGEYFEETFSSLKKHTNWSVFNHRHVKDDNLPLAPIDEGRIVGLRYRFTLSKATSWMNTGIVLEAEQALDKDHNTLGEYNRYFANAVNTWKLSRDDYLKIRLAGGYSDDALPASRSFTLGGLNTLRGFDYQSVPGKLPFTFQYGGSKMALCNIEYLAGGGDDVGLIFFADAGGVWMKNQDVDFKDIRRNLGVSIAFDPDFFDYNPGDMPFFDHDANGLRVNWAVPVGNEPHVSKWTINFVQGF